MNIASPPTEAAPAKRRSWFLRRAAFMVAALFTLIVAFYVVESWRGRKAWDRCQQELRAQGEQLDWAAYVPARVPDGQNFIKTPLLEAVGYRSQVDSNAWETLREASQSLIWETWVDSQSGRKMDWGRVTPGQLLQDLREVEPQLDELRAASLKPFAQFDIDRSAPFEESPEINFVAMRTLSQILAFHACAEVSLAHHEKAFADVRVIHRLAESLKGENTLVAFFIRVAVQGLAMEPFWEGWAEGRWNEQELAGFQEFFGRVDLPSEFPRVLYAERAGVNRLVEKYGIQENEFGRVTMRSEPAAKGWWNKARQQMEKVLWNLIPRGWVYQNLVSYNQRIQALVPTSLRSKPPTVSPAQVNEIKERMPREIRNGPYSWLSRMAIPHFLKGLEKIARVQTSVNQAAIVCALERFRLAHREYPASLTQLTPQFIHQLPLDVIDGGPMKYRRTNDGKFVLYSVGWNEKDDGGIASTARNKNPDAAEGDWVWQFASGN